MWLIACTETVLLATERELNDIFFKRKEEALEKLGEKVLVMTMILVLLQLMCHACRTFASMLNPKTFNVM